MFQVWGASSDSLLSITLKRVVTYDNIRLEQEFETRRVDQDAEA